jgi:hypothetical protein
MDIGLKPGRFIPRHNRGDLYPGVAWKNFTRCIIN